VPASVVNSRAYTAKDTTCPNGGRYPTEARKHGIEGTVVLQVLVGEDGRAIEARVETSSGNQSLDYTAATCIVAFARFNPKTINGIRVKTWTQKKWVWSLKS
jgi:protein TonB